MSKPVTGTYEWASHSVNCVNGCMHDCHLCYAKTAAIKSGKKNPETWKVEEINYKAVNQGRGNRKGTIMFPTTHDLTPNNMEFYFVVLEKLLFAGNKVLIVSKPHIDCISALCEKFDRWKENILFRFTIGSTSDRILKFWEPGAPPYLERIGSLILAYRKGFQTSVSGEPMLDGNIVSVVDETDPYVTDSIWVGKANKVIHRLTINGANEEILTWGRVLENSQNDAVIRDLYNFLKDNPKIKWKDSIKQVVGLERPKEKGLDI